MESFDYMSEYTYEYIVESPFIEVNNWSVHIAYEAICRDCSSDDALDYCHICGSNDVAIYCENCGEEYEGAYNDDYCEYWQCSIDPSDVFEYDYESIEDYRYDLHVELMLYYSELLERRRVALCGVLLSCSTVDSDSAKLIADYVM